MLHRKLLAILSVPIFVSISAHAQTLSFIDVSETHLPSGVLDDLSMDAKAADLDGDGDLDLVIANEWRPNIILINDGAGRFSDASDRLPPTKHDSEDVALEDFDRDGDIDIVIVTEDDQVNEYFLNDGTGHFHQAPNQLPVRGTTNGVIAVDINNDRAMDLVLANNGQNNLLINDGAGVFHDETTDRLPVRNDTTQDVEAGDVDDDGDLDLLVGNEGDNRLLINNGEGRFVDQSESRLPLRRSVEETREADFGDADGDGDLDIFFANVRFFSSSGEPSARLLINDGTGHFTDESAARLKDKILLAVDGDFVDFDGDGDLDLVTAQVNTLRRDGKRARFRIALNDGAGTFTDATEALLPASVAGFGFDSEAADFNGDGLIDFYFVSRGSADILVFGQIAE